MASGRRTKELIPSLTSMCVFRSVLMLGYPNGLQLWDCSNLGSVSELLNLTGAKWGAVEFAGVLPDPLLASDDAFRPKRPLIGFS